MSMTEQTCLEFDDDGFEEDAASMPEVDELDQAWLCDCGHYEESGLHCSCCGREPPWGCDCGEHDEDEEEEEDYTDWFDGSSLEDWS